MGFLNGVALCRPTILRRTSPHTGVWAAQIRFHGLFYKVGEKKERERKRRKRQSSGGWRVRSGVERAGGRSGVEEDLNTLYEISKESIKMKVATAGLKHRD